MRRSVVALIVFAALGALAAPLTAEAQTAGKVYRIGALSSGGPEQEKELQAALRERLRERGWVEGQNLIVDWRYAEGNYGRIPELIDELVRLKPDVLMTRGGPATTAARRATASIPIVMWGTTDPAGIGVAASLSRPGGNVTGLSDDPSSEITGKRLQLLKQVAPEAAKVAVLTRVPPSSVIPRVAEHERSLQAAPVRWGSRSDSGACRVPMISIEPSRRSSARGIERSTWNTCRSHGPTENRSWPSRSAIGYRRSTGTGHTSSTVA